MRKVIFNLIIIVLFSFSFLSFLGGQKLPQQMPEVNVDAGGNASFSIPLEIPSGTGGLTPTLSLSYNSGGGDGLLGKGWSLDGAEYIKRDSLYGISLSNADHFVSSEYGQLVDSDGSGQLYYSKNESLVSFYPQGSFGLGPSQIIAYDKSGNRFTYGGENAQVLADNGAVRVWALAEQREPHGEVIRYEWELRKGELYLSKITYAGGVRYIKLNYEEREDFLNDYSEKQLVVRDWRLKEIKFYSDNSHVHSYEFTYSVDPKTKDSLLAKIDFEKDNFFSLSTHLPLEFVYATSHNGIDSKLVTGANNISDGYGADQDIGDRMFELLKRVIFEYLSMKASEPPKSQVKLAKAYNKVMPRAVPRAGGGTGNGFDYNALNVDMPQYNPETEFIGRYPLGNKNRDSCNWGPIACICTLYPACPPYVRMKCGEFAFFGVDSCNNGVLSANRIVLPTDVDGDGITEYSRFLGRADGDQIYIRSNDYVNNRVFSSPNFPIKYNTYIDIADIDGDGKTDFIFERSGILHVAFSNGSGFENPTAFVNVTLTPYIQNYTRTANLAPRDYTVDINRDGRTDFVHFWNDRMSIYLSQGRSFATEKVIWFEGHRSPLQETMDSNPFIAHRMNQFADIDGDGIPEHLLVVNVNPPPEQYQLAALKERQFQEVGAAEAERLSYTNEIFSFFDGGQTDDARKYFLAERVFPDDRPLYWDLVNNPNTATAAQKDTITKSVDRQFFEDRLKEIVDRHANELDFEISRIRNADLSGSAYQLVVTKINLNNKTLSQTIQDVPRHLVGYMGKNWLVDINGDGLADYVSFTNRNSHFNPYDYGVEDAYSLYNEVKVAFNTGGKFDFDNYSSNYINTVVRPDRFAEKDDPYASKVSSFDFADLNEDGILDFVVKELNTTNYHVYHGKGNGKFVGRFDFNVESTEINGSRFEDRNGDGIPDFFYQFGKNSATRQISSDSPLVKGGMLTKVINNLNGVETEIAYVWKKNMPGAVVKGSGSYATSLPNLSPQMLVSDIRISSGPDFTEEKIVYSYYNARFKPGDIDTNENYGFESITKRTYLDGTLKLKEIINYMHNPNFPGLVGSKQIYTGNNTIVSEEFIGYSKFQPHGSITKLIKQSYQNNLSYENGQLKDQISRTLNYDSSHGYEISSSEENFNGKITTEEFYYTNNSSLKILAQLIEIKKSINGTLIENKKYSYSGVDVVSESKLVGLGQWYSLYFSYDSIGNMMTSTDSLGRTLSYEYQDITRSKPTLTRNALNQTSRKNYDPKFDVELSVEDTNGNITNYEYDSYGRKIGVFLNGEKQESIEYYFDGSRFATKTTTQSEDGSVWSKETSNLKGKVIRKESLVAEGIISTTEIRFDSLGRETQESNAYLTGETPLWTNKIYYSQFEDTLERPKEIIAPTGEITNFTYGLRSNTMVIINQSEIISTEIQSLDLWGRLISKTIQGESLQYSYDNADRVVKIKDPANDITNIAYDIGGRKVQYSDSNSGTTNYTYNAAGDLLTQSDSRGIVFRYNVDGMGRITKVIPGNETPIVYEYDTGNSISNSNEIGKLSKVTDSSGITEYAYDRKGNVIGEKRIIDDLQVLFQRTYDPFGRLKTITYPEGTLIRNHYTGNGKLAFLTMDSHDGTSLNHTVVSYEGPKVADEKYYIERKTGNGVLTRIGYDPLRLRPQTFVTYLKDNSVEQSIKYEYDKKGNISSINDLLNESRNQRYEYDHLNRITKAMGKFGEENYSYHRNGNLLNKGSATYSYENGNHIHAVSKVNSPNMGIIDYTYDSMGNMINRNGDTLRYNAQNKLKQIETNGGDRFDYTYDYSGMRIKKYIQNSDTTTYSFGNFYEIHRSPGQQEQHTLYIMGIEGDIVAQYSRGDAILINQMASTDWLVNPFCKDVNVVCSDYWNNRLRFSLFAFLEDTNLYVDGKLQNGHRALPWFLLLAFLLVLVYKTKDQVIEPEYLNNTLEIVSVSFLPALKGNLIGKLPRFGTAFFVIIFSFTSTVGCFPIFGGAESASGTPIWLIGLGNGIPINTPSVGDDASIGGNSGSGSSGGNTRVTGMYFFHPDHLGSITMITDGNGNVLVGGERGGKSHITYKPYGEILRTDSYGPDITKFKYTGQEEDRESGLYYYKSRYYDSSLGRFLSNDSIVYSNAEQGMNRMMYVNGNPIKGRDFTGNGISPPLAYALVSYFFAPEDKKVQAFLDGWNVGKNLMKERERIRRANSIYLGVVKFGMALIVVGGILMNFPITYKAGLIIFGVGVILTAVAVSLNPNYQQDQRAANVNAGCIQATQVLSYYFPTMTYNNTTSVGIEYDPIKKIEQDRYEKLKNLQAYQCSGSGVTESID
ncbi:RHS repeat-associated protein [Leptospira meyeri]|uniref:RHS repeat-associated protein n=1 Tax=Leptospira meyeri TaxID=29508 RepID=A0A4R8MUC9_LEPME|nr:RHS repeat-associated core domain-containing protein [Leptospira meyeri]TDY71327.1 RHS repeat-associated protein [Leptospira meyeri]